MLTAKKVERTKTPGRYRDGLVKGLLLQITNSGAKSWVLRFELRGKERMMGLGSASEFNLKEARERARSARQLLADGVDPLDVRRERQAEAKAAAVKKLSFREAAERYFNQHQSKWTNASHRAEFLASLRSHAFPVLGDMDVAKIELADVLRCIEPIWTTIAITADRVRNRIENVLDWCVVRGHRPPGTNPARWKNHLSEVLPAARQVAPRGHHRAIDYRELPAFMVALRAQEGVVARALEFLIYTASRRAEVLGAVWDEINFTDAVWIIPPHRMKARREHRVPLAPQAIALLRALPHEEENPHVFVGAQAGQALGGLTLARLLKRMGRDDVVPHGMRAVFSTWASECTSHANHAIELALAHNVGNEVERAYRRGPMLAKRARLAVDWARYCCTPPAVQTSADVVAISGRK